MPTKKTSSLAFLEDGSNLKERYIPDYDKLKRVVTSLRRQKKTIVLTQGVYDLIHEGHAAYLEKAKTLGDILIVGVDSDELTRARKGPRRPIVPQTERLKMLVHLRHVDIVTVKELHHGLGDLIKAIKPDVMVFSSSTSDISPEDRKVYEDVCGKIIVLPPQATTTTTARVRNLTIEGAEKLGKEVSKLINRFLSQIRSGRS